MISPISLLRASIPKGRIELSDIPRRGTEPLAAGSPNTEVPQLRFTQQHCAVDFTERGTSLLQARRSSLRWGAPVALKHPG